VVRPRACLALAELRYAEAIVKPEGARGRLGARQTASVLEPLRAALRHPSVPGAYGLLIEAWSHSEARPGGGDLQEVADGAARYPRSTPLSYRAALLCSQNGRPDLAAELIDRGLVFAEGEAGREPFLRLRSTLAPGGG
jgi:hypothetical protein